MPTTSQHPPTHLYLARLCQEAKNSLTLISIHAHLLSEDAPPNQHIAGITDATHRLTTFMHTLEEFTKADQGRLSLRTQPCQLPTVLTHLIESIGPDIEAHSLTLHLHFTDFVPPLTIDPTRVHQILLHLLSNAIQFTPPGGCIDITSSTTASHVTITVTDTGRGIDASRLPTIFEPFTTLNPDWHPNGVTHGLGLALARHLARLHNGELLAYSNGPGCGSTFKLTLPLNHSPSTETQ